MSKDLKELYYEVKALIDTIDFNKLWEGFKPLKFALYNDNECFFDGNYIEKTDSFIANTAINYNGEVIAIWNVMNDLDPIVLTSKMVHEMFHGFQMLNNESRFPNELEALYNYQYDLENLEIKLEENKLIAKLLDNFNNDDFNKLLGYRKYRLNHFPYEYKYETKVEQIEGSANYIEIMVLKELSDNLYSEELNSLKSRIINKELFLPIRIISYDIGALLILLCKENNVSIDYGFIDNPFSYELVKDKDEVKYDINNVFSDIIKDYYEKAKATIDKAILANEVVEDNEYDILGVNVYNAVYYNNYIISTFFVMYGNENSPIIKYGNFVIETKKPYKLSRIYKYE